MYTEGKTLHVPVIDNGLVPRLCFDRNPTQWTARLWWYAKCNTLWVAREYYMRCEDVIGRANAICDMRICNELRDSDMWYTSNLRAICEYVMGRANTICDARI